MTRVLADVIRKSNDGLQLSEAATELKRLVPEYVGANFPGATQTPELIDNMSPPFFIRPR